MKWLAAVVLVTSISGLYFLSKNNIVSARSKKPETSLVTNIDDEATECKLANSSRSVTIEDSFKSLRENFDNFERQRNKKQ